MADVEQWVNLPYDEEFAASVGITDAARIGAIHLRLKFKRDKAALSKIRLEPDSGNIPYSQEEQDRNFNYRLLALAKLATAKPDGSDVYEPENPIRLPAAGGNRYRVVAKDSAGNTVEATDTLVAQRLVQIQVVRMAGWFTDQRKAEQHAIVKSMAALLWKDERRIKLVPMDCRGTVTPIDSMDVYEMVDENGPSKVSGGTLSVLLAKIRKAVKLQRPEVGFILCWLPYLADKKRSVRVFPAQKLSDLADASYGSGGGWIFDESEKSLFISLPDGQHLWEGFDLKEDARHAWFETAELTFHLPDGTKQKLERFPRHVHVNAPGKYRKGKRGFQGFRIKLEDAWTTIQAMREVPCAIVAKVYVVADWSCGQSFGAEGIIAVADRVKWEEQTIGERKQILLHEIGHRLGFAATGDRKGKPYFREWTPDAPPRYYDQTTVQGTNHVGRHCHEGTSWNAVDKRWSQRGACVMFGAVTPDGTDFCAACAKTVRKADLENIKR